MEWKKTVLEGILLKKSLHIEWSGYNSVKSDITFLKLGLLQEDS